MQYVRGLGGGGVALAHWQLCEFLIIFAMAATAASNAVPTTPLTRLAVAFVQTPSGHAAVAPDHKPALPRTSLRTS